MITQLYVALLGLLYMKISVDTIKMRRKYQVSIGNGPNNEIALISSAHSNFSAYVPILLILLYSIETSQTFHAAFIHFVGITVLVGRLAHYLAFKEKMNFKLRILGMHLTLWPLFGMSAIIIVQNVQRLFS